MRITDFNVLVSKREGRQQQLSIAQIAEVMAVANALLDGHLYSLIRSRPNSSSENKQDELCRRKVERGGVHP